MESETEKKCSLRYHPAFKNPQTEVEKQAREICRKYVWDK